MNYNQKLIYVAILALIITLYLTNKRFIHIQWINKPKQYLEKYKQLQPYHPLDINIIFTEIYNQPSLQKSTHINKAISSILDQTIQVKNIFISSKYKPLNNSIKEFVIRIIPLKQDDYMKPILSNQLEDKSLFIFISKPYHIYNKNIINTLINLHNTYPDQIITYNKHIQIVPNQIIDPDIIIENKGDNITNYITKNHNIIHINSKTN